MKKVILTATVFIFTLAMLAQTGYAPGNVKTSSKELLAQNTIKPSAEKADGQTKKENKKKVKKGQKKGTHHTKKDTEKSK